MAAPRKYFEKLRERAIRLTLDVRKDPRLGRVPARGSVRIRQPYTSYASCLYP